VRYTVGVIPVRDADHLVIGLGVLGSAAAYHLARATGGSGETVVALEQHEPGHAHGSSHGDSRLFRLAHEAPADVALARAAYDAWLAVQAEAEDELLVESGVVSFFPVGAAGEADRLLAGLADAGEAGELLDGRAVRERWPAFGVPDDVPALFEPRAGVVRADRAIAAFTGLAREHGAQLVPRAPVRRIAPDGDRYLVRTDDTTYRARRVVLAAGAWTAELAADLGLDLEVRVTQEQVVYFPQDDSGRFAPAVQPAWIRYGEGAFYGFPDLGPTGVKAAQHLGGVDVTAATRTYEPDPANLGRVAAAVRDVLPGVPSAPPRTLSCLYALSADGELVLDTVPGHPGVAVAIGCGHGFKFAPLLGQALADLVRHGSTAVDVGRFGLARPGLAGGAR
jgi:sarcosine oxidase